MLLAVPLIVAGVVVSGGAIKAISVTAAWHVVDVVVLGAVMLVGGSLVWVGVSQIRKAQRIRRAVAFEHGCRACGYAREGLEEATVCPECGAPFKPSG